MPSSVLWQEASLPQAAACLAHVLSMHLPQSLLPSVGGGGAGGGASAVAAGAGVLDESAGAADDAVVAEELSSPDDAAAPESFSSAGVWGGLPPPQATQ